MNLGIKAIGASVGFKTMFRPKQKQFHTIMAALELLVQAATATLLVTGLPASNHPPPTHAK